MNDSIDVTQLRPRTYVKADRAGILELLRLGFPASYVDRLARQWDWKYDRNPFNAEADAGRSAGRAELFEVLSATYLEGMAKEIPPISLA